MLNNSFLVLVETVVLDARDTAEYLTSSSKTHNGETMIALQHHYKKRCATYQLSTPWFGQSDCQTSECDHSHRAECKQDIALRTHFFLSLGIPQNHNNRVPAKEHFTDKPVLVYWLRSLLALPGLWNLQKADHNGQLSGVDPTCKPLKG